MENGINDCKSRLERLGGSRSSKQEQRVYLHGVSQLFSDHGQVVHVKGLYDGPFFGDPTTDEGYSKRLRAVAQNTQLDFATEMAKKGHFKQIVEKPPTTGMSVAAAANSQTAPKVPPIKVTREERLQDISYLDEEHERLRASRHIQTRDHRQPLPRPV